MCNHVCWMPSQRCTRGVQTSDRSWDPLLHACVQELRMMNSKGVNKQAAPKGTAFSRGLRRTRMINQPKTGF